MLETAIKIRVVDGFDDPTFGPTDWQRLLETGNASTVYQTWHWQRAWWETYPRGELLLIVAEKDGRPVALAPLYVQSRMAFFVGTGFESGYLDFIGDITEPEILVRILQTAMERTPQFGGFRFHFVPENSLTVTQLKEAAKRLGLSCYQTGEMNSPMLDLSRSENTLAATRKKDHLEHERALRRDGVLEVRQIREGEQILPDLEEFFSQLSTRWAEKSNPGGFVADSKQRSFIERLTRTAAQAGWLRFIRIDWNGRPIAFQYGFCYRGRYVREMSTFAIGLRRYGPGQVLLRQSFLLAIEEGAHTFDFGIGDQPYKYRFASHVNRVLTWGLYPCSS